MKKLKFFSLAMMMFIGATAFCNAENFAVIEKITQGKWERLGSRVVNMRADHDEIVVTGHEGVLTAVKLKIMKAPIHLVNMNIIFRNGDNKNVKFDKLFPAGSATRVVDLPGNKRIIRKVNLNYKSAPTQKGKAVVSLWGRH